MKMNHEVKCPVCGKTIFSGEQTVIDRRTGKKAVGLGTLIFGIVLVAIAVFLIVRIIPGWNDRMVPGRQYIYLPVVLLIGGVPIIYAYLRADRAKKITYACASCGKTIIQEELEGTNLARLEVQAKRERGRAPGSTNKIIWIGSVIVVALAVVFLFRSRMTTERQPYSGKIKVAVLPFDNLGLPEDDD